MQPVARLGDKSSHGGTIITATSTVTVNGLPMALEGDLHQCPIKKHGTTQLKSVTTDTDADGKKIITVGAIAGCGAVIVVGSSNVTSQ
jgi:uncharacterized Zn-binding protein involved in type VI secretion